MKTRYFTYGGEPIHYVYRWRGYPSTVTRNAADTRGLSGSEVEYLPFRDSGPEPLDPGEAGMLPSARPPQVHGAVMSTGSDSPYGPVTGMLQPIGFFDTLSDNEKRLGMIAAAAAVGWFLFKRMKKK